MAPTPQQLLLIAQAKRRRAENGAGFGSTNPMVAQGQAAQREWRDAGAKPTNPNPENPIITAQRNSQAQANSAFHEERRPRTDAELAAVKAAKSAAFSRAVGEMGFAPDVMPTQSFDDQGNVTSMGELDKALPWRFGASAVNAAGPGSANAILEIGDAAFGPGLPFDYAGNELDFSKKPQPRITFGGDGRPEVPKPPRMLPTVPLTPARDAAEMTADFGGTLFGALAGPGKAVPKEAGLGKVASQIGAKGTPVAKGLGFGTRTAGNIIENVGYAGVIGANMAPDGQRAETAAQFMADPLTWAVGPGASLIYRGSIALKTMGRRVTPEYVRLQQAMQTLQSGKASPQQMQEAARAVDELTPPDPQAATGAPPATPQSAPVAQAPIPQAAPRPAQAGPSAPGQGAGAAQPVLNATPVAAGQSPVAMAKSDARIIGRLLKAGGVARNDVNNLLAGLVQAYQGSNSSRLPLAFFAEEYLPTVLPKQTADDVIQKLRGFGRERYSANGPKDTSRSTMRNTVDTLRSTQQDNLSGVMDANLYKGKLIGQEDKLNAQLEQNARTAYTTALENANNRLLNGKATQAERDALGEIQALLHNGAFLKEVPAHLRIKAMRDGINLEDYVQKDPIAAAHWLQSELRQAVTAAEGVGGMATSESRLYGEMRTTLLEQLEKVVPGYLGARKAHGDIYGAKEAIEFGGNFFKSARSEVETARLARQFKAMSVRQKTAATMSIRDALKNEFRNKAEDTAAKVTRLQQAGVLDALETVLGADGKRVAEAIRNTVKENERIRAVDMLSGSNTADNLAQMEAAQEAVRSPVNKAIGSLGDNRSWAATLTGDALLAANGLPPLLTGGKIASSAVGKLGKPSAQKLASATKTLYDLPAQPNVLAAPPKPPKVSGPRAPKPPPEQIQATLDDLLNQYSALDHRANPAAGQKLLRQIERLKKQLPTPNALSTPPRPPVKAGFGSSKPLDMSEAGRSKTLLQQLARPNEPQRISDLLAGSPVSVTRDEAKEMLDLIRMHLRPKDPYDYGKGFGFTLDELKADPSIAEEFLDFDPQKLAQFQAVLGTIMPPSQSGSSKLLAGMGASPEGLGAAAGGAAGYFANPTDANGDGVIDDADRGLNAMGLMITGGLGVKAARMGVGAAKSGANALRDIGKNGEPFGIGRPELELTQRATPPKPTQAGFGGSGGKAGPQKPPANALAGPISPRVLEDAGRAAKRLPQDVRNKLSANAASKDPAPAMQASGFDPNLFSFAQDARTPPPGPVEKTFRRITQQPSANALEMGLRKSIESVAGQRGRSALRVGDEGVPDLPFGMRMAMGERNVARKEQSLARRAYTSAEKKNTLDTPKVQRVVSAEREARVAQDILDQARLDAFSTEDVGAIVREQMDAIAKAMNRAPPSTLSLPTKGQQVSDALDNVVFGAPPKGQRVRPKAKDASYSASEANDAAKLLFSKEYAAIWDDIVSGRTPVESIKPGSKQHLALTVAAVGGLGALGITSAILADRAGPMKEPQYPKPEDPRVYFDWDKQRSNRRYVENLQVRFNQIDPRYRLREDGQWVEGGKTDRVIRFWQDQNGFTPDGSLTEEQAAMIEEQAIDALRSEPAGARSDPPKRQGSRTAQPPAL